VIKNYKVSFVISEISESEINMGVQLDDVVTASSKAAAVMQVVDEYHVYKILSVERVKRCRDV